MSDRCEDCDRIGAVCCDGCCENYERGFAAALEAMTGDEAVRAASVELEATWSDPVEDARDALVAAVEAVKKEAGMSEQQDREDAAYQLMHGYAVAAAMALACGGTVATILMRFHAPTWTYLVLAVVVALAAIWLVANALWCRYFVRHGRCPW